MKLVPAYRIQSVHWTNHIGISIQEETKKQGYNFCFVKGKGFTLVVGWKDSNIFLEGLILNFLWDGETLNSFLLDGNKKNVVLHWILIVWWKSVQPVKYNVYINIPYWHFFYQETKKQGQNKCYEKGRGFPWAVGWEHSELFPEEFILKLMLDGEIITPSYWMEIKIIFFLYYFLTQCIKISLPVGLII